MMETTDEYKLIAIVCDIGWIGWGFSIDMVRRQFFPNFPSNFKQFPTSNPRQYGTEQYHNKK
jgi:hypothetical protein